MDNKSIYKLKLHETTVVPCGITVMRVAGGWLYDIWNDKQSISKIGVFVSFNDEFQHLEDKWKYTDRPGTEL